MGNNMALTSSRAAIQFYPSWDGSITIILWARIRHLNHRVLVALSSDFFARQYHFLLVNRYILCALVKAKVNDTRHFYYMNGRLTKP